jgi:type I restriction enzyme R subunit
MNEPKALKPGWKVWRFDQIATNVNVRIDNPSESGMDHYVGLEHLDCDSLKIRRWGSPDDVEATKLMFKKGDIIFARRRAYQRKLGVAEFDGICSAHAMVLRAKPEVVFSVATEGKEYHYGSIGLPVKDWGPWHLQATGGRGFSRATSQVGGAGPAEASTSSAGGEDNGQHHPLQTLKRSVQSMLQPAVVLDILCNFTLFATDRKQRRIKIICRYQQYEAANKIVARVLAGFPRKGLIWHFQGSGKSLLMVFAAQKLRMHPGLKNPTVLIVVDRVDLDSQITGNFTRAAIPNLEQADSRERLQQLLAQDVRKIIITTIFKFGEASGPLNGRDNIIALVDEAHRTQEGDLGRKMREALPNAFLFGLTGTPINRSDRNTFYAFGADEDEKGYLSRYGFEESIRDGSTLKLHFEPRLVDLHIDKAAIDAAFQELTGGLSDLDRDTLAKTAAKMAVLVKTPARIRRVCEDLVAHFQGKVEPNGFKGQIVTFDRESCLLYKAELDRLLPPEASEIVMSVQAGDKKEHPEYAPYDRGRDAEERLLKRFRDPADPLKLIIVTAKLLTGFDAPILQVMYLDKPLRDHTLLQAICRVNRTYSEHKTHGLIVDYLGIFDDVAAALQLRHCARRCSSTGCTPTRSCSRRRITISGNTTEPRIGNRSRKDAKNAKKNRTLQTMMSVPCR